MGELRGFGFTFDIERRAARNWYIDREGVKRWADNDKIVSGLAGLQDKQPAGEEGDLDG